MILTHMLQTSAWLGKCPLAVVALVRLTTGVGTDMANQSELHCEGLPTNVTLVRA